MIVKAKKPPLQKEGHLLTRNKTCLGGIAFLSVWFTVVSILITAIMASAFAANPTLEGTADTFAAS
jgi:hypothetical protein